MCVCVCVDLNDEYIYTFCLCVWLCVTLGSMYVVLSFLGWGQKLLYMCVCVDLNDKYIYTFCCFDQVVLQ